MLLKWKSPKEKKKKICFCEHGNLEQLTDANTVELGGASYSPIIMANKQANIKILIAQKICFHL